jgi:hypothetical protein
MRKTTQGCTVSEDRQPLHQRTVYIFTDGSEQYRPTHNNYGWLKCFTCGFTLDSTGNNLPVNTFWRFTNEIQPNETLVLPLYPLTEKGYARLRKALQDKEWYIGDMIYGWSYDRGKDTKASSQLSDSANQILAQLLQEPKV